MADSDKPLDAGKKPEKHVGDVAWRVSGDPWTHVSADLHAPGVRAIVAGGERGAQGVQTLEYSSAFPAENSPRLYRTNDALQSIRAADVCQGDANDCFFMSSLAAVAATGPQLIKDAIKQNADGSFVVTFAGDRKSPVQVPALTDDELKTYAKGSPDGTWPAVMEKAFGIYLRDHPEKKEAILGRDGGGIGQSISNWFDNHIFDPFKDPQQLADSGRAPLAMELLTGNKPGLVPLTGGGNVEGAKRYLSEAFADSAKVPVVAAIGDGNPAQATLGLNPKHCYTVLGYANGMVTLRDPYGKTLPNEQGKAIASNNGVFTMKVEDFAKSFDELYTGYLHAPGGVGIIRNFSRGVIPDLKK